jgi:hypothetical protein
VSKKTETPEQKAAKREKQLDSRRRYREHNRERLLQERRESYQTNREHRRKQAMARYWKNHDRARAIARASYRRNPKRVLTQSQKVAAREKTKRYRARHKEKLQARERERLVTDPAYAFARLLRSRVGKAVKEQYAKKAFKTMDLIGCTVSRLLAHLEAQFLPGMKWENYGRRGWHIDHILPCAAFDLSRPDHQKKCFHYSNLRPAWSHHNEGRGSRIEGELPLIYRHKKVKQPR